MICTVHPDDAPAIAGIYNHYVLNSPATFEEVPVSPDEMRKRILETTRAYPWLVSEEDGKLLGYCYGRQWRERAAYRHSVEVSVYLDLSAVGKGRGSRLLGMLLPSCAIATSTALLAEWLCPIRQASRCLKSSDCDRWRTSKKSATNLASGSTLATGNCCCDPTQRGRAECELIEGLDLYEPA